MGEPDVQHGGHGERMSRLAHAFFPRFYRLLRTFDPLIAWVWRRVGIGNTVLVVIQGRRSGQPRPVYLGLLRAGGRTFLGHPDVDCDWTLNLEAAGAGEVWFHGGRAEIFSAYPLEPGPERDAAIRATFHQHPFPGNVFYWLARRHVRAVGRFYRVELGMLPEGSPGAG